MSTREPADKDNGKATISMKADGSGVQPVRYVSVGPRASREIDAEIVDEALVCISVNGQELATFMCSPVKLKEMTLGFLYNESLIAGLDDVRSVHISKNDTCVDVWLHKSDFEVPKRKIVTAGCGGGVTFDDLTQRHEPLMSDLRAPAGQISRIMRDMHLGAELYRRARGIHTAALTEEQDILLQVEDVGRHNCLDRLAGAALIQGVDTRDRILLSSGRISSEMVNKARRLETPIVCSRTSPTSLSVALAESWNISIVAYVRQDKMRIYTHPERILDE